MDIEGSYGLAAKSAKNQFRIACWSAEKFVVLLNGFGLRSPSYDSFGP